MLVSNSPYLLVATQQNSTEHIYVRFFAHETTLEFLKRAGVPTEGAYAILESELSSPGYWGWDYSALRAEYVAYLAKLDRALEIFASQEPTPYYALIEWSDIGYDAMYEPLPPPIAGEASTERERERDRLQKRST